ncbi:MAG: DinB family protein [Candidatus Limnocylindria bacterium]
MGEECRAIEALFRSLSASQLDLPVFGEGQGWRVRDIPAHLALWQWVATRVAEKVSERGQLPDTPDWDIWAGIETPTDELNDENFRDWRDRPVEDALGRLAYVHAEMIRAVERLTPEQIASGTALPDELQPFLRAPGVRHIRAHRKQIESALGGTEILREGGSATSRPSGVT